MNAMLNALKELNEKLSKMTDEEIADLFSEINISEEEAKQYARLERFILGNENKMIEFIGGEWFNIAGRGNVYSGSMPETVKGSLIGKAVKIEGFTYIVNGIEMFALNDPTLHKGRRVGILVRGPRKDK